MFRKQLEIAPKLMSQIIVDRDGYLGENWDSYNLTGTELTLIVNEVIRLLGMKYNHERFVEFYPEKNPNWAAFFTEYGRYVTIPTPSSLIDIIKLNLLPYVKYDIHRIDYIFKTDMYDVQFQYTSEEIDAILMSFDRAVIGVDTPNKLIVPQWVFGNRSNDEIVKIYQNLIAAGHKNLSILLFKYQCKMIRAKTAEKYLIDYWSEYQGTRWISELGIQLPIADITTVTWYLTMLTTRKLSPDPSAWKSICHSIEALNYSTSIIAGICDAIAANGNNIFMLPSKCINKSMVFKRIDDAIVESNVPLTNWNAVAHLTKLSPLISKDLSPQATDIFLRRGDLSTLPDDHAIVQMCLNVKILVTILSRDDGIEQLAQLVMRGTTMKNGTKFDLVSLIHEYIHAFSKIAKIRIIRAYDIILQNDEWCDKCFPATLLMRKTIAAIARGSIIPWVIEVPEIANYIAISKVTAIRILRSNPNVFSYSTSQETREAKLLHNIPASIFSTKDFLRIVSEHDGYVQFNYKPRVVQNGKIAEFMQTNFCQRCEYNTELIYETIITGRRYGYLLDIDADENELIQLLGDEIGEVDARYAKKKTILEKIQTILAYRKNQGQK